MKALLIHDAARHTWLRFRHPVEVMETRDPQRVAGLLAAVEERVESRGLHAAGFLAYEAAPAFDPTLAVRPDPSGFPLLWFGLFQRAEPTALPVPAAVPFPALNWAPSIDDARYRADLAAIREAIRRGDTYQVNHTLRLCSSFAGDPDALFLPLAHAHRPPFGAVLPIDGWTVCSFSPELFFRRDGERIESRPMKGTIARQPIREDDLAQAESLRASPKDRAENAMIVDMVRNDLGRIAETGSVAVTAPFAIEQYPTLWQMTATVAARTRRATAEVMAALFPAASITGAPKASTMGIIAGLETAPRRIYTGTIGFLAPGRRAQFNVAIRTVLIDHGTGTAEYGVGGGIVWDSRPAAEAAEWRTKARILADPGKPFELLETLLWRPGEGYWLLDAHLERLAASAAWFGIPLDSAAVRGQLERHTRRFGERPHRIRLLVDHRGAVHLEHRPLTDPAPAVMRLVLAETPVDAADPFLYHKTTRREVYDRARAAHPGADDVLLQNGDGELTETTIANIVVELEARRLTPPLRCGLLGGCLRRHLLETGAIEEGVIPASELHRATGLWIINSVRGMVPATIGDAAPASNEKIPNPHP